MKNLNYGEAIEALKRGEIIARTGWNKSGMFVFRQIPTEIPLEIIPKMQSVPAPAKEHMLKLETTLKYSNQMALVQPDGRVDSWVASSSDTFAEDWFVVDAKEETSMDSLVVEEHDLSLKIDFITDFIGSDNFKAISNTQQDLLKKQLNGMEYYANTLAERIEDLE